MKKIFIKEVVLLSHMWFVTDCDLKELSRWMEKKFNYPISDQTNTCKGKMIHLRDHDNNTQDWIIWVKDPSNVVTIAHELIHFVKGIFDYRKVLLCDENEEFFTMLHTYYFERCLELTDKKIKKIKFGDTVEEI